MGVLEWPLMTWMYIWHRPPLRLQSVGSSEQDGSPQKCTLNTSCLSMTSEVTRHPATQRLCDSETKCKQALIACHSPPHVIKALPHIPTLIHLALFSDVRTFVLIGTKAGLVGISLQLRSTPTICKRFD